MNINNTLGKLENNATALLNTQFLTKRVKMKLCTKSQELSKEYAEICNQHRLNKKWILMINPENEPLSELASQNNVDTSKVLKVDINKTKFSLKNVEQALINGNCSAVVLSNACLDATELQRLQSSAEKGDTNCIVINRKMH